MKIIPYLSLPILINSTIFGFVLIVTCSCGLREKIDRRIAFAVLGMEDHGEQLLKFEQFKVKVRSSKDGHNVEISAPGNDLVGCGDGTGPKPYSWEIDQVVGIANGGNKTLRFSMDTPIQELFYMEWDKVTKSSRYQLIWSSKGAKKKSNKPVDATARSPVVRATSTSPTHHLLRSA